MKGRAVGVCLWIAAAMSIGCNAASRHKVLGIFFDGVPPPDGAKTTGVSQASSRTTAGSSRVARYREHGPYAAKLCGACHDRAATNALVVPAEQLCFRCHELRLDKKYVHGPLASGGCLVCHDPHSSQYDSLLVSESDGFCFHCHDRESVAKVAAHEGVEARCTGCHDAHLSDKKYLLR